MRRTALVLLALAMLAGTGMAQELNFGKYGIGVGFGSQYFFLNNTLPPIRMNGTYTRGNTIYQFFRDISFIANDQVVASSIPIDATWRPIEALGVRIGANYLLGSQSFKYNSSINETWVDTAGIIETTIQTTGSETFDIANKISGFPFTFSLVPSFKIGDKVLLQPEAGIGYYSLTLKGDKGTFTSNTRTDDTDRNINTGQITNQFTTVVSESYSGKMPEVKYTGLGTFWGFEAQVLVHKNVAVRAQLRKGTTTLKEKYTDVINRVWQSPFGGGTNHDNDSNPYESSLHVATEAYALGLVYNF